MDMLLSLPGLLIALVFHELAHGFTAYYLGDNTAKNAGRLSLNPLKHIDPLGFLFMFLFKFGWAKPVPIDPRNFKNRKRDTLLVSIAGPFINFVIAILVGFTLVSDLVQSRTLFEILRTLLMYNIIFGVFNLLPFPPLDGSKIVASLLPIKLEYLFYKYEKYLYLILILLIMTNVIDRILGPLIVFAFNILIRILS